MKRSILLLTVGILGGSWIAIQSIQDPARTNSTGSANGGGNTGSTLDGNTCAQAGCHDDDSPVSISPDADLTTDVPGTGYIPGQTYTVTAQISKNGHSKFGFEVTAEANNNKVGSFTSTSTETQLTNNGDAVTHTSSGTSGSGGNTWTFEWDAPSAGTGAVMFDGAFNVTNNDATSNGDTIHTDTTLVFEDTSATAIPGQDMMDQASLQLYPNPATDRVSIEASERDLENARFILRDLNGRIVKEFPGKESSRVQLDLEGIPSGAYLLEVNGKEGRSVERLMIE